MKVSRVMQSLMMQTYNKAVQDTQSACCYKYIYIFAATDSVLQGSWDSSYDADDAEGPAAKALRSLEQQVLQQQSAVYQIHIQFGRKIARQYTVCFSLVSHKSCKDCLIQDNLPYSCHSCVTCQKCPPKKKMRGFSPS